MKSLQIRETPEATYRAVVEAAKKEGRSLSQQALVYLAKATQTDISPKQRRKEILRNLKPFQTESFNATRSIREDRDR